MQKMQGISSAGPSLVPGTWPDVHSRWHCDLAVGHLGPVGPALMTTAYYRSNCMLQLNNRVMYLDTSELDSCAPLTVFGEKTCSILKPVGMALQTQDGLQPGSLENT